MSGFKMPSPERRIAEPESDPKEEKKELEKGFVEIINDKDEEPDWWGEVLGRAIDEEKKKKMGESIMRAASGGGEDGGNRIPPFNKGVRFIIVGPPHSGKTVFSNYLAQCLDPRESFLYSASVDGENRAIRKHYDKAAARNMRKKGEYNEEVIERNHDVIRDWNGKILLVDFPGDLSSDERKAEKARMLEDAPVETYAIIIAGSNDGRARKGELDKNHNPKDDKDPQHFTDEMDNWEEFLKEQRIEVIAKVHSNYEGKTDNIVNDGEHGQFKGSVHHLDRKNNEPDPIQSREVVRRIAQLIEDRADKEARLSPNYLDGEFVVNTNDLIDSISHKVAEAVTTTPDGKSTVKPRNHMIWASIPEIYQRVQAYGDTPVKFDGPMCSWGAMAIASALKEMGNEDFWFRDTKGMQKVKTLPIEEGKDYDSEWWEEPEQIGELNGKPIIKITCKAEHSSKYIEHNQLDSLKLPNIPEDAVVLVSTPGPNWLKASITMGYMDRAATIISHVPFEESPVVWSRDENDIDIAVWLGENDEGGDSIEIRYPEPVLDDYLEWGERNLANTSRTASGNVDVSSSATKGDIMAVESGEEAAKLAEDGFITALEKAYDKVLHVFNSPAELRSFIEELASTVNNGILKDGVLYRSGADSTKHPYTKIANLEGAMDEFCNELFARMNNKNADPIETAAFAEYTIDLADHFFADGCGKTSKVISSFILMRAGMKLPDYSRGGRLMEENRKEYYSYAPKTIPGENPDMDKENYENFVEYYRTLFSNMPNLVKERHAEQTRNHGKVPYVFHLNGVSDVLEGLVESGGEITDPALKLDLRDAALGHDLLEDTKTTKREVFENSNARVLKFIEEMTNPDDDAHTERYMEQLMHASEEGRLIKYADLIENTFSVVYGLDDLGLEWTRSFFMPIMNNTEKALASTIFTKYPETARQARAALKIAMNMLNKLAL